MDNDNKIDFEITKPESKKVSLFLQEELIPLKKRKTVTTYNLEREYAKTRKNHNYSIWITMIITVLVVVFATWIIVSRMTVRNENIKVSLNTFEDLNMRNLFDALSKTQDLYEKAAKTKAELQASFDSRSTQALQIRDADLENLNNMKLTRAERIARENSIRESYNSMMQQIHEEFDEKLIAADFELKQYEEQLKNFDSENVEKAQAWEKEMDSQRQVHEIETRKLTEDYENQIAQIKKEMTDSQERNYQERRTAINNLTTHYESRISKLDPVIQNSNVKDIINKTQSLVSNSTFNPDSINQSIIILDEEYTSELNLIKEKYDDFVALNDLAKNIPFENGMKNLVNSEQALTYDMTYSIAQKGAERISELKAENIQLSTQLGNSQGEVSSLKNSIVSTNALLDDYAKSLNVDGFILNYDGSQSAVIFLLSSAKSFVKNDGSTTATVFDNKNVPLVTGAIWFKDTTYLLSLDEVIDYLPNGAVIKINE